MKEIAANVFIKATYAKVTVGAILTADGWVCVDTPPYPRDAQAWRAELEEISPKPILYVINTDHHRDRILGNSWFNAPVVAHEAAAEHILSLRTVFISQAAEELSSNDNELVEIASLKLIPPQISFSQTLYLLCGKRRITLVNKPSASLGSTWVVLPKEKIIFTGDTVVTGQHPYISGSTSKSWLDTLRALRGRYGEWALVSGRDAVTDVTKTESLSEYLRVARRRVKSLWHGGRPRAEITMLIPEFLSFFPYEPSQLEDVHKRIKVGLEAIYEEFQLPDKEENED